MSFDGAAAVGAALIAGAAMSAGLYMGIAMMPKQMKMNLFLMLGTMVFSPGRMAYAAGAMAHAMMSIVFGLAHAGLYVAMGLEGNLVAWGVAFGLAHWLVAGMGLGMLPVVHPMMRAGKMGPPGVLALSYPRMTAMGFLMLHVLFGVLVAALYQAFV